MSVSIRGRNASSASDMVWDDNAIAKLRQLWTEGHPASEIGRRLGCCKNAVVGKKNRLGLEGRPSPLVASILN